jgi:transcriptional regulator with XRE-family HTH domain
MKSVCPMSRTDTFFWEEWVRLHRFHSYSGSYETKDLARFLGVSTRTIQRWLKDKTKPNKARLAQIGEYLTQKEPKNSP